MDNNTVLGSAALDQAKLAADNAMIGMAFIAAITALSVYMVYKIIDRNE